MATSKVTKEDAQEWLASLQLSGEGWYRNLALAVKANAHKALGMERREFAAQVGQRMIDPREAIVELHREGHDLTAIADILGVDRHATVGRTLAEEGLIEMKPAYLRGGGHRTPGQLGGGDPREVIEGEAVDVEEELQAEIDKLATQVRGEQAKRKREVADIKAKLAEARKQRTQDLREARKEWEANQSEADRERALKEAEAEAAEQGRKVLAGIASLGVQGVVGGLEEATEHLQLLVGEAGLTAELIREIEAAHAAFTEELNVARAALGSHV